MSQFIDIPGKPFGRLKVLKRDGVDNRGNIMWLCVCRCGKSVIVRSGNLRSGHTRSCGCLQKEKTAKSHLKHGHARTKKRSAEYVAWQLMMRRCYDPNRTNFFNYGGRGIRVCNRWRGTNGFKNFYSDMGKRPTSRHSLDRIKNDKGYSRDNCRWATRTVQNLNRRRNSNNTSGITGVYYNKKSKKFHSYISINGKNIRLGYFEKFKEAVSVRRIAEKKYHKPILERAKYSTPT